MIRIRGGLAVCAAAHLLLVACGKEVPRAPPAQSDSTLTGHACDLVTAGELSQIFVSELEPTRDAPPGESTCTWNSVESGRALFRYEIRSYMKDLRAGVRSLSQGDANSKLEVRQGLGDAAVWSDLGLFVSRNGRTLQVTPFDDEIPRALYEELASLLLERLESGN